MQKQPNGAYCIVRGLDNVADAKVRSCGTVFADSAAELPGWQLYEDEE